ncbi:hypothetical protein N7494_012977 [Penicillium frequentans]|uniref:Uncharacterized protein n=1 Tax=Penicillium frequentans TaxID=3151616 RepID=A0AAD6GBQ8_9EURO|nr:hypothetical protein N7494_012977 [Penicillium glabrum]
MKWQEVSPGRYERPFDSIESFYRIIASADETGARFRYTVPSQTELDAWVQESFIVDNGSSANEKIEGEQPSSMFLLFYLPSTRELLFRTPHWRIDGIGLMDLQNAFLRILANVPSATIYLDGSEAKYLTPSLDGAAAVPLEVTPETTQSTDDEIAVYQQGQPSISIATLPNVIPTATRRIFSRFAPEITTRIISACKTRGLTVTAAMHAAMVVAILPNIQHNFDPTTRGQSGGKYTAFNAFDLRKYVAPPFNGPAAAVNVYHTGIPFSIDLEVDMSFESIAAKMLKQYKRDLSKDDPRNVFQFLAQYVGKVLSVFGSPASDPLRAPAYPELSSLGRVNDHIVAKHEGSASTIEVEDWWVAIENISRLLIPHVWTWNGELVLSVNFNESFYEYAVVSQFLEGWKQTITEVLGVN